VLRTLAQDSLPNHRAIDANAVLGVVNALRFASTRPMAGPPGFDDASARQAEGHCAMVGQNDGWDARCVDVRILRAYVVFVSAVPHGTSSIRQNGQRSAFSAGALRALHRALPLPLCSPLHGRHRPFVGAPASCETCDLFDGHRPQGHAHDEDAPSSGTAVPWIR
jgi:hypothetical protein